MIDLTCIECLIGGCFIGAWIGALAMALANMAMRAKPPPPPRDDWGPTIVWGHYEPWGEDDPAEADLARPRPGRRSF